MGRGRLWNCCRTSTASISNGWPMGLWTSLLLQPFDEPPQDANPYFVLADRIFDAVLNIGVVVDFHHHDPIGRLLEIDAVEPVADRPGRPDREVHHVARRLIEIERAVAAL